MHYLTAAQPHILAFAVNVLRLCVWLVLLTAIFTPLERYFAVRREKRFRKGFYTDLGYYFLSSLLPNLLLALPLAFVAWSVHLLLPASYNAFVAALPMWVRVVAAVLVGEVGFYWGHRLSHEIPFLWRFHAIHHSSEHIDFMVSTRAHPVDMVFTRLLGLVPLYALGIVSPVGRDAGVIPLLIVLVGTIWGFFIHSNVRWRLGPFEQLISTPAFHHWHHTRNDHIDHNYAPTLPWIDRIFGTFYLPKRWPEAYGTDTHVPASLPAQLLHPMTPRR
jgi:sterol desaturase/sphingolipid hydroxylase (fatty acid hydroxylase superfamily)